MRMLTYLPWLATIGGVELHMLQALRNLAARGVEIHLRYTTTGDLHDDFATFCASLGQVPFVPYGSVDMAGAHRLSRAVVDGARCRPDVVYANNFSELVWADAVAALSGASIVCHLHEASPFRPASVALLGSPVSRFVVASEFMRDQWMEMGIAGQRAVIIPYGIDPETYRRATAADRRSARRAFGIPERAFVALYLGRLDPEKGVETLLEAWRELALDPADNRLLIVGSPFRHPDPDSYLADLRALAPPGCMWEPMRRDVLEALHASDVLVLPSKWAEPFGRVVIEALATGQPVVASDTGGIPEILTGDLSEFLFAVGDAGALADRLGELRTWRTTRPGLSGLCERHALERYSLTTTGAGLERTLRSAVASGSALTHVRRALRPG